MRNAGSIVLIAGVIMAILLAIPVASAVTMAVDHAAAVIKAAG